MIRQLAVLIATVTCGTAHVASAQHRTVLPTKQAPRAEIALVAGGLWSLDLDGQSGSGGRVTLSKTDWLASEWSVDTKPPTEVSPRETLAIVNARAQIFNPDNGAVVFITAGAALSQGLNRTVSPVVGIGTGRWLRRTLGWRVDVQRFPGGPMQGHSSARLILSAGFGIQ